MRASLVLGGWLKSASGAVALEPLRQMLDGVAETGSLRGAASRLGLSYRAAWGRLVQVETALGQALVTKTKGHGSSLTPFGRSLLGCLSESRTRLAATLAHEEQQLTLALDRLFRPQPEPARLIASHDPLLVHMAADAGFDLTIAGSETAVGRLLGGEADAAGFHHGDSATLATAFPGLFSGRDVAVHPLFRREQGLIVAAGNPLGIASIADIARLRARFINRQRGSGTRAWLDRLLASAGIPAAEIRGYEVEEFTHQAVAAMVAAGAADAGMGVRIAAERLGLAFLPLGQETYYLAGRANLDHPAIDALLARCREPISWAGYSHAV
jgi:molybdate transport repressor ModE-like protein